jgi:hypothetical protein
VRSRFSWLTPAVFARRLLTGVVIVYTLTSLLLGGTVSAKPTFHALAVLWAAALVLLSWRGRQAVPGRGQRVLRLIELVATNLALTLLLGELMLRACTLAGGNSLLLADTLAAHRLTPGRDYGHGLRGNNLGYPGPDFRPERRPGVYRIAALGDSFAVGPAVPFADNYLTLLENALPATEVYNFGVSGAGPREYLHVLRHDVWPFRPDLVLVSVFVGNDITETLATPRHLDPRQHALYLLCVRGLALARERQRQAPAPAGNRLAGPPLSAKAFQSVEARRLAVCLGPVSDALEGKWRRAFDHLDQVVAECRSRRTAVAFVLIPDELQVNPEVLAEAVTTAAVDPGVVDLDLPQRRLRAFCAERGVPCLDLRPSLAAASKCYAPRDTHWNARGNHLAAEQIARWLESRALFPGRR